MLLGEKIKFYRELNNLSQLDLAERIGMTGTHIRHIEKKQREPQFLSICKIAKEFELTIDKLIEGTEYDFGKEES